MVRVQIPLFLHLYCVCGEWDSNSHTLGRGSWQEEESQDLPLSSVFRSGFQLCSFIRAFLLLYSLSLTFQKQNGSIQNAITIFLLLQLRSAALPYNNSKCYSKFIFPGFCFKEAPVVLKLCDAPHHFSEWEDKCSLVMFITEALHLLPFYNVIPVVRIHLKNTAASSPFLQYIWNIPRLFLPRFPKTQYQPKFYPNSIKNIACHLLFQLRRGTWSLHIRKNEFRNA